jgi:hypothetical protein
MALTSCRPRSKPRGERSNLIPIAVKRIRLWAPSRRLISMTGMRLKRTFARASSSVPAVPTPKPRHAVYLTSVGRPAEAVIAMQRAVALDPLSFWANRLLGSMLYYSRRYNESLVALTRALELAPDRVRFVEGGTPSITRCWADIAMPSLPI